jgi:hypothetical protein
VEYSVSVLANGTISDLKESLGKMSAKVPKELLVIEVYKGKLHKHYKNGDDQLSEILPSDEIFVYKF